jgi:hypothetical protein
MENTIAREEDRLAGGDEGGDLAGSLEQSLREDTVAAGVGGTKRVSPHPPALLLEVKNQNAQETTLAELVI